MSIGTRKVCVEPSSVCSMGLACFEHSGGMSGGCIDQTIESVPVVCT